MDLYVRRIQEKTLDCCNTVDEEVLVNACLHGMLDEYHVYLENLSFLSFFMLMEAARRTNEFVKRTSKWSCASRPNFMVRPATPKEEDNRCYS